MSQFHRKISKLKRKAGEFVESVLPTPPKKEPPPDPDLVQRLDFVELAAKAVTIGDITYVPEEAKVYTDRIELVFSCVTDCDIIARPTVAVPRQPGDRLVSFTVEGQELRWDLLDHAPRFTPVFDPAVRGEFNPWVAILDSRVIRVEREYALHNLSEACLAYAFAENEDSFDWCIADHSCIPVVFELNPVFWTAYSALAETVLSPHVQDNFSLLSMHTWSYPEGIGMTVNNFIEMYKQQATRPLWEPDAT